MPYLNPSFSASMSYDSLKILIFLKPFCSRIRTAKFNDLRSLMNIINEKSQTFAKRFLYHILRKPQNAKLSTDFLQGSRSTVDLHACIGRSSVTLGNLGFLVGNPWSKYILVNYTGMLCGTVALHSDQKAQRSISVNG